MSNLLKECSFNRIQNPGVILYAENEYEVGNFLVYMCSGYIIIIQFFPLILSDYFHMI